MNDLCRRLFDDDWGEAAEYIEELETINEANLTRIWELESGMQLLAEAIENGDEIEFIPEKKM